MSVLHFMLKVSPPRSYAHWHEMYPLPDCRVPPEFKQGHSVRTDGMA